MTSPSALSFSLPSNHCQRAEAHRATFQPSSCHASSRRCFVDTPGSLHCLSRAIRRSPSPKNVVLSHK
ncbi:hypothetical protein PanWU01x14_096130, partial [Parasponia andersonii]